jgi:hypothetical protein
MDFRLTTLAHAVATSKTPFQQAKTPSLPPHRDFGSMRIIVDIHNIFHVSTISKLA